MQRENVNLKVARKVVKCLYRPWNSYSKCINNRKAWKIPTKVCFSPSDGKNSIAGMQGEKNGGRTLQTKPNLKTAGIKSTHNLRPNQTLCKVKLPNSL